MGTDFNSMMQWLGKGMAEGIGFNAGETFDPPHEVTDKRLQPDVSFGAGQLPMNKSRFPQMQSPALAGMNPAAIFPSQVLFPNLAMHLRAGLPFRCDFALRAADMTTPSGYKLSPSVSGKGQSNSYGATLRKHFFGGESLPLLTFGANFNHVQGRFSYASVFDVNEAPAPPLASVVNGNLAWNVDSYGLNAVVSQQFGAWIPFAGLGYNYVTGSVTATLQTDPESFLVLPTFGSSTQSPSRDNGRVLFGLEHEGALFHLFVNGEVAATGIDAGKAVIVQTGVSLPIHIGLGDGEGYASSVAPSEGDVARFTHRRRGDTYIPTSSDQSAPGLIFIQ